MNLLYILLSLFTFVNADGSNHTIIKTGDTCTPQTGTYVVITDEQLDNLNNCSTLEGNLFIHGGLELTDEDLLPLNNLRVINGYLVIWNSQNLHCLMGLYNLESILGNDLYLDQYALYIKDNFKGSHTHDGNETREGLCYVDTLNWDMILNNIDDLEYQECSCSDYRNGASSTNPTLCMGPSESWGRPCYPMQNNQCNADWTKCSTSSSNNIWCDNSPSQTCRMLCPTPNCDSKNCAMRDGSCCSYHCEQRYNNYLIDNNGDNCPSCHEECVGCFSEGPRYCQDCLHYKSGDTCVSGCPLGTTTQDLTCIESVPSKPTDFNVTVLNRTTILSEWSEPTPPNGVILGYELYRNGTLIFSETEENYDLHHTVHSLLLSHTCHNLIPYTRYSYKLRAYTSVGFGDYSDEIVVRTFEDVPPQPSEPLVTILDANTVNVSWFHLESDYGPVLFYELELYRNGELETSLNETEHIHLITMEDLEHNTLYSIRMRGYSNAGHGIFSNFTEFTTPYGIPSVPQNLTGEVYSSSTIHLSWLEPQESNSIITNYSYEVYNNSILLRQEFNDLNTKVNITNLDTYTSYNFRVNALTRNGAGNFTPFLTLRTDINVPPKPLTPILSLVNNNLQVVLYSVSNINGPIILYRLYLLNLNTQNEGLIYEANTLNTSPINLNVNLDYDTNYSVKLIAYTSDEYYSESDTSNVITTEGQTTTTELPTTIEISTEEPTPNNRQESTDDSSDELVETLIYIAGTLGGFLLLILLCIRYIKKKKVSNVEKTKRPVRHLYTNPLYNATNNVSEINTIEESTYELNNSTNNSIINNSDEYIEVGDNVLDNNSDNSDSSDVTRIGKNLYDKVKIAGMIPRNMIREDEEGTNL